MKLQVLEKQSEFPFMEEDKREEREKQESEGGICLIFTSLGAAAGLYLTSLPYEHYKTTIDYLNNLIKF